MMAEVGDDQPAQDLSRIRSFSDGVLAISITLLALNIDVPNLSGPERSELPTALLRLWPDLWAFVLSFAVVGRYWLVHNRTFMALRAVDATLMNLNLLFLGLAAVMPFASELLARYGDQPAAAMTYGAVIGLASLTSWAMINHARRRELLEPSQRVSSRHFGTRRALLLPGLFAVSIPVALVSPLAAEVMWVSSFLVHPARRARAMDQGKRSGGRAQSGEGSSR